MSHSPDLESPEQGKPAVNAGRRRFARAGAAAPVVLGTLASEPVLATGLTRPPHHCTMSGKMSVNASPRTDKNVLCKSLGKPPSWWCSNTGQWVGCTPGGTCKSNCSFNSPGEGTYFNDCTANGKKFAACFFRTTVSNNCVVKDKNEGSFSNKASVFQVLTASGTALKNFGAVTAATYLNARKYAPGFPLTPEKVIDMFNAVYDGAGTYKVNASTNWTRAQVQSYFQSLYS